jgi:hypothetical protein
MDPAWARSLLAQCRAAGIPFFMKRMSRDDHIPPDLLIREFPRWPLAEIKPRSLTVGSGTHGATLYVPSRGRAAFLHGPNSTLTWIKATALAQRTVYCVRSDEVAAYERALAGTGVRLLDCGLPENIGEKRAIIAETARAAGEPKFLMVDDDLRLLIRKSPDAYPLRYATPTEAELCVAEVERLLDVYALVGVSGREGNNRAGNGPFPLLRENTRAMRMLGYRTEDYLSVDANRLPGVEDFDTTLQLLALWAEERRDLLLRTRPSGHQCCGRLRQLAHCRDPRSGLPPPTTAASRFRRLAAQGEQDRAKRFRRENRGHHPMATCLCQQLAPPSLCNGH